MAYFAPRASRPVTGDAVTVLLRTEPPPDARPEGGGGGQK